MQIVVNILLNFSIYLLIAYSFVICYYPTKFFHLSHAVTITSGAYFTYSFSQQFGLPLFLAIAIAIILSIILGIIMEICLYKPLRKRHSSSMILMIASLGLYIVMQNAISLVWGDGIKRIRIGDIKEGYIFFNSYITEIQIITVIVCILLVFGGIILMNKTKIGRNIRAVASNSELSNTIGINSNSIIFWSFFIASGLASVGGILIAFDIDMTPTMGFNWLLYGVVAMIIGGIGSNRGLIGGALLLATIQNFAAYYVGSQWMDAIAYIILILFLIWKPLGFSGKRLKKVEI